MVFLKEFFIKVDFEKNRQTTKKARILPRCKSYHGEYAGNLLSVKYLFMLGMLSNGYYYKVYGEGGIEKSVPRITVQHQMAFHIMTSSDPEGWIFYPIITQIMDSFSYISFNSAIFIF